MPGVSRQCSGSSARPSDLRCRSGRGTAPARRTATNLARWPSTIRAAAHASDASTFSRISIFSRALPEGCRSPSTGSGSPYSGGAWERRAGWDLALGEREVKAADRQRAVGAGCRGGERTPEGAKARRVADRPGEGPRAARGDEKRSGETFAGPYSPVRDSAFAAAVARVVDEELVSAVVRSDRLAGGPGENHERAMGVWVRADVTSGHRSGAWNVGSRVGSRCPWRRWGGACREAVMGSVDESDGDGRSDLSLVESWSAVTNDSSILVADADDEPGKPCWRVEIGGARPAGTSADQEVAQVAGGRGNDQVGAVRPRGAGVKPMASL